MIFVYVHKTERLAAKMIKRVRLRVGAATNLESVLPYTSHRVSENTRLIGLEQPCCPAAQDSRNLFNQKNETYYVGALDFVLKYKTPIWSFFESATKLRGMKDARGGGMHQYYHPQEWPHALPTCRLTKYWACTPISRRVGDGQQRLRGTPPSKARKKNDYCCFLNYCLSHALPTLDQSVKKLHTEDCRQK